MFDLEKLTAAVTAETASEKLFVKYCRVYGLEPEYLHKTVKSVKNNIRYEIIGLKKNGRFACIDARDLTYGTFSTLDIRKVLNKSFFVFE